MASYCKNLHFLNGFILIYIFIEGITAVLGNEYYHYNVDKIQTSVPTLTKLEILENEQRFRRYVNGPISKLSDSYDQGKTRFISQTNLLTNSNISPRLEEPVEQMKETKTTNITSQTPPSTDTNENRVHRISDPQTTANTNEKPPVVPSEPSIVAADFDSAISSTILPSIEDIDEKEMTKNLTTKEDNHLFYNSTFTVDSEVGQFYWVDMTKRRDVITNMMLSASYRRAATVKLNFSFPFYGHTVRNITIATGGFIYTGEYVHSWLAATQYIAPLMANFDTSLNNVSYIKYVDNGTAFTVQWEKVVLQDRPESGDFTFQATLHNNGDIVFVYQNIPIDIEKIHDVNHPVKVGLSDAYIIDRTIFFIRRKTIYEYHRVNFRKEEIKNWTVIYLKALPTCLSEKSCKSCLMANIGFECSWCPAVGRCSTGMDRMRQDWVHKECDKLETVHVNSCDVPDPKLSQQTSNERDTVKAGLQVISDNDEGHAEARMGTSSLLGALFVTVLICGVGIWTMYAYNNPHSSSGQILIKYRPTQWSWRRGETRYTAATIHM
uniref:PSI domain-containing protein n=1 Tax=Clastoptera arizonana TaxID=38151 RepID=A0A1B6C4U2_9HEMI